MAERFYLDLVHDAEFGEEGNPAGNREIDIRKMCWRIGDIHTGGYRREKFDEDDRESAQSRLEELQKIHAKEPFASELNPDGIDENRPPH